MSDATRKLTDPDEFMRFHLLLTKDHPEFTPHYIKVNAGDAVKRNERGEPIDKKDNPVPDDDPNRVNLGKKSAGKHIKITVDAAIRRLKRGLNVGIEAVMGDEWVLIDVDDPETVKPSEMKPTLTTRSRKRAGFHYFYTATDPTDERLGNIKIKGIGEIRSGNQYVLTPGSWVDTFDIPGVVPEDEADNAGKYTLESAAPIAGITFDELPRAFRDHLEATAASNIEADKITAERRERREARKAAQPESAEGEGSALFKLELSDVLTIPTTDPTKRVKNPLHPGGTGTSAGISDSGYLQCYSDGVTHTALSALAVLSGVADCESAGQGFRTSAVGATTVDYTDGRTLWKMWSYAMLNGMLPKDDPVMWNALQWYAIDQGVFFELDLIDGYKFPPGAVSRTKAIIKSKEGIEIINIGKKKPKPETPAAYGKEDGCFVKYVRERQKGGEWKSYTRPLCNFSMDLQRDTLTDDSITKERWWEGEIFVNGHRMPFKDEARKFITPSDHGRVLATAGGSALMFDNRDLQDIRHAMASLSTPECRNIRQTFGLLDAYTYETPSVMIDRDGVHPAENGDIDLSGKGNSKHLDMQVLTDAQFKAVGEHIRDDLLNLHTRYIIDSLTGFTFLAPFGSELIRTTGWTGDHIGIFLVGTTGSGKSFDAIMFQWFFGDFSTNGAITSWTATPNELQVAGYYFKDAVYLVDDFKLSHFKGNLPRYSAAIGILQNYTDGTARDRLTSDIKIREGQPIRGALIATGEDFPHNEASVEGRYHVVHVSGGGSREAGHLCLKNRHLYNGFMARYIAWVFQKDNYAADIVTRIDAHRELFISGRGDATNIDRLAQSFAYNLTGYELFCHFMIDSGFVDTNTAHTMIDAHKAELNANIDGALDAITSATASMMYLEILSELIASGRFRIHDESDLHKVYNEDYNRDEPESEEYVVEDLPLEDLPFCIGFDDEPDDPYLYIIPNIAFAEVCRVAATQGMLFTHTQTGTGKELIASGVMMEGKGDGIACAKWYQDRTRKVWKIAKRALNYERVTKYSQMGLEDITR